MADVAKLAGVSHQTVSRVINDSAHVRPETKQRVLAAMRQLDYRPNPAARALVTGRSGTLGVVSFDTTLYGPGSTLFAIEQAAHAAGYFITIVSLLALDRTSVLGAVERLRVQGVDGILVITPQEERGRRARQPARRHPAGGGRGRPPQLGPAGRRRPVRRRGQRHAAAARPRPRDRLARLGPARVPRGPAARRRLARRRWRPPARRCRRCWWATGARRSGYRVGLQLAGDLEVTAIFVANDQMALGVLRALHERGREIPREVSIVGFDDIPEAQYFTPPLTTVRQDFGEMGRSSLRLLLELMQDTGQPPQRVTIAPELVVRRSTAPPPKR